MATALTKQQANHLVSIEAVRAGSRATVEELKHHIHAYKERDAVECPKGFRENQGHVPHFPIVIDGFTMQARYVKYIDQGRIMGTMGGPNDASSSKTFTLPPASMRLTMFLTPSLPGSLLTFKGTLTLIPSLSRRSLQPTTGVSMQTSSGITAPMPISSPLKRKYPCSKPSPKPFTRNLGVRVSTWRMWTSPVASVTCKRLFLPPAEAHVLTPLHTLKPLNPSAISGLTPSPVVGLLPNRRVMTPAVLSGPHVVDRYIRVGPNWWSRHSDVRDDAV